MATYIYPDDLHTAAWQHRKFTIHVREPNIDLTKTSAYKYAKNAADAVSSAVSTAGTVTGTTSLVNAGKSALVQTTKFLEQHATNNLASTRDVIVLPLPNSLNDSQDHGWNQSTSVIGGITQGITDKSLADVSVSKALGNLSQVTGRRKPLFDPGYFQNYEGSEPRSLSCDWDFVPKNVHEAEMILTIIMKLKEYSSPKRTIDGVSLLAPYFFKVKFGDASVNALINMNSVVISNISVDYGADGNMQQMGDGMPKHMKLSLTFKETKLTTADDYAELKPHSSSQSGV